MQDPTTRVRLIPGHAGRGRKPPGPTIITLHVQEGTNDLYYEFLNRPADNQADCTMWSKQDGSLERFLYDTDTPWTNGYIVAPDMSNPYVAEIVNTGTDNSNRYAYTIEHQGFASKGFTNVQIEATAKMCAYWVVKEGWEQEVDDRLIGHFQIGDHKGCPGALFPWSKLKARVKELVGTNVFNPNPDKFSIGQGVVDCLTKNKEQANSDEVYYTANPRTTPAKGFLATQRSFTMTKTGNYVIAVDLEQPDGRWDTSLYKKIG